MAILYLSAWEYIREKPFQVHAPAFYHAATPEAALVSHEPLERPNPYRPVATRRRPPAALYPAHDPHQLQLCSYPIVTLVDMFQKKISYQLANEEDVVEIIDNIDRFLLTIQPDVEQGDEKLTAQAEVMIAWRDEIYKHYYRYMMTHPEAKARLYPNHDETKNIFHLMNLAGKGGQRVKELDPLKAMARPPYDIHRTKPQETVEEVVDDTFVGLPAGTVNLDDDGSFTLGDFMNRN